MREQMYYLIERNDVTYSPHAWWDGHGWTVHATEAVRFSRPRDATAVMRVCRELHGIPLHITEHMDVAPR